jgi:predicted RNA binding protein YcfA (HicA-like mRNA interferase family)
VLRELAYYRLTLAAHLGLSQLSILHLELVGLPVDYRLPNLTREEKRSKGSHHSFRDSQGRKITIPKKGGQKVKGIYVQQIVELLNLEELSDDDTESEEQAD